MAETPVSNPPPDPPQQPPIDPGGRRQGRLQLAAIAISILALVVSAATATFTFWQATRTNHAGLAGTRALISVSGPQVAAMLDPNDKSLKAVGLTALFTNSGDTPTKNLFYFMRCVTSPAPAPEPWNLLFQDKIEKQPQLIGPQGTASAQCTFSGNQIREMSEGKLYGYVLGDITYHDRRDDKTLRRTQFSWRLADIRIDPATNDVALTAIAHGQHNCADEQCPLAIMTR